MNCNQKGIVITNSKKEKIRLTKYDKLDIEGFCEGLAIVSIGNKCGFINEDGEEICPIKYDMCWPFREDGHPTFVKLNGKYALLNREGKEITPIKYDRIDRFSEDRAFAECGEQILYLTPEGKEITITLL